MRDTLLEFKGHVVEPDEVLHEKEQRGEKQEGNHDEVYPLEQQNDEPPATRLQFSFFSQVISHEVRSYVFIAIPDAEEPLNMVESIDK